MAKPFYHTAYFHRHGRVPCANLHSTEATRKSILSRGNVI